MVRMVSAVLICSMLLGCANSASIDKICTKLHNRKMAAEQSYNRFCRKFISDIYRAYGVERVGKAPMKNSDEFVAEVMLVKYERLRTFLRQGNP